MKAEIVAEPAGMEFRTDKVQAHAGLAASGWRRRKWRPDAQIDAVIRHAYTLAVQGNDRQAIKRASQTLGWPRYAVIQRAAELGLARIKELDWSLEEIAILRANTQYGHLVIRRRLAEAGFKRSRTAIVIKRKRLDLVRAYDGYSATQLAGLMGIDAHFIVDAIKRGWLGGERRGTARTEKQGGDTYFIKQAAVKTFLFAHPEQWDLRKVDQRWFLDLLTDGEISR